MATSTRRQTPSSTRAQSRNLDDALDDDDTASTIDPSNRKGGEFAQFAWQELNGVNSHLKDLSEKYGRLAEKIDGLRDTIKDQTIALASVKTETDKFKGLVTFLKGCGVTLVALATAIWAIIQFIAPHVSITLK